MKIYYLIPLVFLSACSTTPKLTLRPQQPPAATDTTGTRYPEVLHAYHIGRYAEPWLGGWGQAERLICEARTVKGQTQMGTGQVAPVARWPATLKASGFWTAGER